MSLSKLKTFVQDATRIVSSTRSDIERTKALAPVLGRLVAEDDWLPDAFAQPHPQFYQQYLLHCDPMERFSVVSFVWGPGQQTPVHDHTVWGLIGMLRGSEISTPFMKRGDTLSKGDPTTLTPGTVEALLPEVGDIHQVRNAHDDCVSISIHVYGANIGAVNRHVFDPATGAPKSFVSGFSSPHIPNIWA